MQKVFLKGGFFCFSIFIALFIISCPTPLNEEIVIAVEDDIPPVITITSPRDGGYYMSTLTVAGTILDSAIKPGDNRGSVGSIIFSVQDASELTRTVSLSKDSYSVNPVDNSFSFDFSSGVFDITLPTQELDKTRKVSVRAVDGNGNSAEQSLSVLESEGVYLDLVEPGTTVFTYDGENGTVYINGYVSNSDDDYAINEVKKISWSAYSNPTQTQYLDLTEGSPDASGDTFSNIYRGGTMTLAQAPGPRWQFNASFQVGWNNNNPGSSIDFIFTAEDYSGHISETALELDRDAAGPDILIITPDIYQAIYYSSAAGTIIPFEIQSTAPLNIAKLIFDVDGSITEYEPPDFGGTNSFFHDVETTGCTGTIVVNVTAEDADDKSTTIPVTLLDDVTKPAFSGIGIISDNGTNTSFARPGNLITLTFTAVDNESGLDGYPVLTITSAQGDPTADVIAVGGDVYQATYTMAGGDTEGEVTFTIDVDDVAWNSAVTATGTTNGSSVTYYAAGPILDPVSISSDNFNPTWAKVGDTITVSFTSNQVLNNTPTVTIAGDFPPGVTVTPLGGNDYEATYTMQSGDTEGVITFSIGNLMNAAGDTSSPVTSPTVGGNVTFDKTPPADPSMPDLDAADDQGVSNTDNITNQTSGLTFRGSKELDSILYLYVNTIEAGTDNSPDASWDISIDLSEGSYDITAIARDAAGNPSAETAACNVKIDGTDPAINSVTIICYDNADTSYAGVGDAITLDFTAADGLSGIAGSPAVSIAGDFAPGVTVTNPSGNNYQATYVMDGNDAEGTVDFTIDVSDQAGNTDQAVDTTNSSFVVFYKTGPVLSDLHIQSDNSTNNQYAQDGDTIELTFTSSQVLNANPTVTIAEDNSPSIGVNGKKYTATITINVGDPTGDVNFLIEDIVNKAGIPGSDVSNLDIIDGSSVTFYDSAPTLYPVSISSDNANSSWAKVGDTITVSFTSNQVLNNDPSATIAGDFPPGVTVTNASGNNYQATYKMQIGDVEGVITFSIYNIMNAAGMGSSPFSSVTDSSSVTYDKTAPVVAITSPLNGADASADTVIEFNDDEITNPQVSVDNTNWTGAISGITIMGDIPEFDDLEASDDFTLYLRDIDLAGNEGIDSITLTKKAGTKFFSFSPDMFSTNATKTTGSQNIDHDSKTIIPQLDQEIKYSDNPSAYNSFVAENYTYKEKNSTQQIVDDTNRNEYEVDSIISESVKEKAKQIRESSLQKRINKQSYNELLNNEIMENSSVIDDNASAVYFNTTNTTIESEVIQINSEKDNQAGQIIDTDQAEGELWSFMTGEADNNFIIIIVFSMLIICSGILCAVLIKNSMR